MGEPIGEGGFAVVLAAVRESDGAQAAIKVGLAESPMQNERFRREAEALERIGPPHVPKLHGSGRLDDGRPYIAMERLIGRTLADELAALPAPPDPAWVSARAGAVLAAVEAAHARGVIHRDLKPENIFMTEPEGRAVLLDFGLTKRAAVPKGEPPEALLTRAGTIVGTLEYMAPEQIRGDATIGAAADLYAFGVILFELLTLRPPFVGESSAIEHGHLALRPPRPGDFVEVPAALEEIALACLSKEPGRRPLSAAALRDMLVEAQSASPTSGPRSGPASAPRGAPITGSQGPKLIAEGRHPVVVVVFETSGAAAPVVAAIAGRKGHVVRQRGARYVGVFSGRDADDPIQAALAAARELVDQHGARAALHLASVTIRSKDRGPPAVYGVAVERPETWMPAEPWSGVVLSAELDNALPAREEGGPASVRTESSLEIEVPLLGRDDVVAALTTSVEAAFDGTCPGLFTLIGDAGLGKSRLAAEAAAIAQLQWPDALVLAIRAAQPLPGEPPRETGELLASILEVEGRVADPKTFCVERLGEEIGAAVWPAVAVALGWGADGAELAPTARHLAIMRALAEGLRRRAQRGPVAVILDDAHWADDALVDALEYATLDGVGVALWAVVTAQPRFEHLRRTWGARTQRATKETLSPLDEIAGMRLAAELLLPAEYPPAETLRRLAGWAGGNPGCLVEVVRSLKRAGVVRRRPNAGSYYVATAELDALPPSPAWQWLATRQLGALPPEIAACARVCAVLGVSFTRAELERVQDSLDRAGGAGTPVDAGFGLGALVERGLLRRDAEERYSFQNAVLADAIYELLDPAQRGQIHRHALEYRRSRVDAGGGEVELLEALARHASACGEREEAGDSYLRLGNIAFSKHRHVEADQWFTAALALAADQDTRRKALGLTGRGKSRYRLYRVREAREDYGAARELADALGDHRLLASLLLEDATALDWDREFTESARRVEEAQPIVQAIDCRELDVRLLVARGRTAWRQERVAESIDLLQEAITAAEANGDYESRVVALVMLSFELAGAGRLDASESRFQEVISLTAAANDLFHLCGAYVNRVALWIAQRLPERAVSDLRRAIELARQMGNPDFERLATYNVATLLHWSEQDDEALALARRALMLEERFADTLTSACPLLVARILLSVGNEEEARRLVSWVGRFCPPGEPAAHTYLDFQMLRLTLSGFSAEAVEMRDGPIDWDETQSLAEQSLFIEVLLEVVYWRAHVALRAGRRDEAERALDLARRRRAGCAMWLSRFAHLSRELLEVQASACTP